MTCPSEFNLQTGGGPVAASHGLHIEANVLPPFDVGKEVPLLQGPQAVARVIPKPFCSDRCRPRAGH